MPEHRTIAPSTVLRHGSLQRSGRACGSDVRHMAGSPALLGFGIDSFVESLSGMVMIWRFSHSAEDEHKERMAIKLVGVSLIVLATYVAYEAATSDYLREARPKRRGLSHRGHLVNDHAVAVPTQAAHGPALGSRSLATDAKQTLGCIMLSVALLIGTGLHYMTGIWQADPIAGLRRG